MNLKNILVEKTNHFIEEISSDPRWDIQDELMFQVFGYTLYGYAFGLGRMSLFLDVEEINSVVINALVELGSGEKYARGMIDSASSTFISDQSNDIYSQFVGIGHSHFASENISECINSIFTNVNTITNSTKKVWWKFWK